MVDVPCLDHRWDGRKDPLDVGQVRCSQQETPREKAPLHASRTLMVVLRYLDYP